MQITIPDEDIQAAATELAKQYEQDGDPQSPQVLQAALMRWLVQCVECMVEDPIFYALGPHRPFPGEWTKALEKATK